MPRRPSAEQLSGGIQDRLTCGLVGCRGENDGFFDHVPPPIPDPAKYPEEYVKLPSPKGTPGGGLPIGAGFRVPDMVI